MTVSLTSMFPMGAQSSRGAFDGMMAPDAKTLDSPRFKVVSLLGQAIESGKKEDLNAALRLAQTHEMDVNAVVFSPLPHQRLTPLLAMMSRDNMAQWRQLVRTLQTDSGVWRPSEQYAHFRLKKPDGGWEMGPRLPFEHAALALMGLFWSNSENTEKKEALVDAVFAALDKQGMDWNRPVADDGDSPLMVLGRYCTGYAFGKLYPKVKARGGEVWNVNHQGQSAAEFMSDRLEATTITQYGNEELHLQALQPFQVELRAQQLEECLPASSKPAPSVRM